MPHHCTDELVLGEDKDACNKLITPAAMQIVTAPVLGGCRGNTHGKNLSPAQQSWLYSRAMTGASCTDEQTQAQLLALLAGPHASHRVG